MKIGKTELKNPFIMAPLAGITDAPTRRIYLEHGASLVYTEMISAKGLIYGDGNTIALLSRLCKGFERFREDGIRRFSCIPEAPFDPSDGPCAVQLFGSEPAVMEEAAYMLAPLPNIALDINMGCPVPKIVKNGEGSALLRKPSLAEELTAAALRGTQRGLKEAGLEPDSKAVTVKMRIGWSREDPGEGCSEEAYEIAVRLAKRVEAGGASAVAVHGRTREQFYSGKASRAAIKAVKEAVSIAVIGNGDIFCAADALEMMKETGCDAVMMARGALGNPWIFDEALSLWNGGRGGEEPSAYNPPSLEDKVAMTLRHLDMLAEEKGERVAVREMRKFVGWYLKGERGSTAVRRAVNSATSVAEFNEILHSL